MISVGRLGADGVGLAIDLLNEEIHLAADGAVVLEHGLQLVDMAVEPDSLLVDGHFVGIDGSLRQETLLVDLDVADEVADAALQFLVVLPDRLRRTLFDELRQFQDVVRLFADVVLSCSPSRSLMAMNLSHASVRTGRTAFQMASSSAATLWTARTSLNRVSDMAETSLRTS